MGDVIMGEPERMTQPCYACEGCGQVADTPSREPWTAWLGLPAGSSAAVALGVVQPIPCDDCGGTGKRQPAVEPERVNPCGQHVEYEHDSVSAKRFQDGPCVLASGHDGRCHTAHAFESTLADLPLRGHRPGGQHQVPAALEAMLDDALAIGGEPVLMDGIVAKLELVKARLEDAAEQEAADGRAILEMSGEIERLRGKAANALADQAKLKGLSVEDGAAVLELGPPRELVIAWVDAARKMLGDAENYSETRVDFPAVSMEIKAAGEFERYVFTVQRSGKLTPHEARKQAEAERDEAQEVAARLSRQVAELTRDLDAFVELLHSIWLYVNWYRITEQLTAEQKEMWADAVDAGSQALDPGRPPESTADRWWRPVAQEAHEHEWKRCPNCPVGDYQPCACAGAPCCEAERAENAQEAGGRELDGRTWDEFPEVSRG